MDECTFTNNGMFNRHNEYTWITKNPWLRRDTHNQIRFSINLVWYFKYYSIISQYFFIDNILNNERYLHFLQLVLPDFIHELPL